MNVVTAVGRSDHDKETITEAAALARQFGDDLHVVHVRSYDSMEADQSSTSQEQSIKEDAATVAELAANEVTDLSIVPVGLIGNLGDEIVEYANSIETRYIVIGGSKRSPIGKAIFGSQLQHVLLNANQPVLTVLDGSRQASQSDV